VVEGEREFGGEFWWFVFFGVAVFVARRVRRANVNNTDASRLPDAATPKHAQT
jgi:hypothetical protein